MNISLEFTFVVLAESAYLNEAGFYHFGGSASCCELLAHERVYLGRFITLRAAPPRSGVLELTPVGLMGVWQ